MSKTFFTLELISVHLRKELMANCAQILTMHQTIIEGLTRYKTTKSKPNPN